MRVALPVRVYRQVVHASARSPSPNTARGIRLPQSALHRREVAAKAHPVLAHLPFAHRQPWYICRVPPARRHEAMGRTAAWALPFGTARQGQRAEAIYSKLQSYAACSTQYFTYRTLNKVPLSSTVQYSYEWVKTQWPHCRVCTLEYVLYVLYSTLIILLL